MAPNPRVQGEADTAAGAVLGSVVTLWLARSFATRGLAFPVPGTPWRPP